MNVNIYNYFLLFMNSFLFLIAACKFGMFNVFEHRQSFSNDLQTAIFNVITPTLTLKVTVNDNQLSSAYPHQIVFSDGTVCT